jgi:glycosyltransferase involved in cell wall biosynthesis
MVEWCAPDIEVMTGCLGASDDGYEEQKMVDPGILVLIPAWNEAGRIGAVIKPLQAQFPVLVVDDGSEDGTPLVAESLKVRVIRHPQNKGKGVALMTGFEWALEHEYEAVLTLDADGQHDPHEAGKFVASFRAGAGELIIGRRNFRRMPFPRSTANAIGSWMLTRVLRTPVYDNQSGYRLYSRKLLQALNLTRHGFELEVEAVVQAIDHGFRIGWVDIDTIYDVDKESYFHPIRDTLKFLALVWAVARERRKL